MIGEIALLDHGSVRLEDCFGGDAVVAAAARMSYQSVAQDAGADQRLIAQLLRKGHGTPFEFAVTRWTVKLPIFVARQWMRHRMGSFVEKSLRFCEAEAGFYVPETLSPGQQGEMIAAYREGYAQYLGFLKAGLKREQARAVLPLGLYTEFMWSVNARSLMHWLDLRLDRAAQAEHRAYAEAALTLWSQAMPWTAAAYLDGLKRPCKAGELGPSMEVASDGHEPRL